MAISERERHLLHDKLDELMGSEIADIAMRHLPPVGWADVATKHDLTELEGRLTNRFDAALTRGLSDVRAEISDLRAELHAELHAMTRTYILGIVAAVVVVAGLAFGAAGLG